MLNLVITLLFFIALWIGFIWALVTGHIEYAILFAVIIVGEDVGYRQREIEAKVDKLLKEVHKF